MSWKTTTKLGPKRGGGWGGATSLECGIFVVLTSEGEQGTFTCYSDASACFKRLGGGAPWRVPGLRIEKR